MHIIATVGPNTHNKNILKSIINNGVNCLRLNFSHGNYDEFSEVISLARSIKRDIHILQDLSGSKIRISYKLPYIMKIYDNEEVCFCGEDVYLNNKSKELKCIPLNIENDKLINTKANIISVKDNTMIFKIKEINRLEIIAVAIKGGIIRAGKGCNIKGFDRDNEKISIKDIIDINFGLENNVDSICQSFVEKKEDIEILKKYINKTKSINNVPYILGKIETQKGIDNISEIIDVSDGIIIGRGDLIPETSLKETPINQDNIIKKCKEKNKPIIIGTHILNSMKNGKNPSLSEVESIYNHVKNGVSGFLLSGETSIGKAPIKTVKLLNELISRYEVVHEK